MTLPRRRSSCRAGFSLVELLTVIGIIALVIGILLPSISRARIQAKKVKTANQIANIGKALEMFHGDFGEYPDSSEGRDPIKYDLPVGNGGLGLSSGATLTGAHWLARAMAGHDNEGVDAAGAVLERPEPSAPLTLSEKDDLAGADRKSAYFVGNMIVPDTDGRFEQNGGPGTGRPVFIDTFEFPILYYRANARAGNPFSLEGTGSNAAGNPNDQLGVYNHRDNRGITGVGLSGGWRFRKSDPHPLSVFGTTDPEQLEQPTYEGSFVRELHAHSIHEGSEILKPVKADTFILISAGNDGLYGTEDDVTNFRDAL